jgi:hypothetical protein
LQQVPSSEAAELPLGRTWVRSSTASVIWPHDREVPPNGRHEEAVSKLPGPIDREVSRFKGMPVAAGPFF